MNTAERVNEETFYGIIPLLKKEQTYNFWDTMLVTGGFAIATWCYVQGGYVSTMLSFKQIISSTLFSMTLVGLLLCLAVIIPTRYGIDLWIYQRAVFGYKFVTVICALGLITTWGYEAVNCKLFSNSMVLLGNSFGVEIAPVWNPWIALACCLLGWWIALNGPIAVKRSTYIMVPCLLAVGVIIMILVLMNTSLSELMNIKPVGAGDYPDTRVAFMTVLEWNIAFIFGWYPVLGVLPRLVKTERESYWGHVMGYCVIMAWFICIGAMTGLVMSLRTGAASLDPTEWLIALGGPKFGVLSLIAIGFANVTTQAAACYSITVSTKVIKPDWNYKKVATVWTAFCAILIFWNGIWTYYPIFVSAVGAICGPATALLLMDFYVVRKQKFSMNALYKRGKCMSYEYTRGINVPVLIAFAAGLACYFIAYNPITYTPNSKIFLYTTATGLDMAVTAGVYYILNCIPSIKNYLMKDAQECQLIGTGPSVSVNKDTGTSQL